MSFFIKSPAVALRLAEANDLIEFAMRRNPEEYYEFIEQPTVQRLVERAGLRTAAEYAEEFDTDDPNTLDIFEEGIEDVISPLVALTQEKPELTQDQAFAIMRSDVTIATIGLLAGMGGVGLDRLHDTYEKVFMFSNDHAGVILLPSIHSNEHADCKAVETHNSHLEMSDLFKKFAPWAGHLAVLAHFTHREL